MSSARSVGVIYDDKPLVQLRKEDKLANHSSQRNNASEEQPLRQCWGPRNIVALSDKGLKRQGAPLPKEAGNTKEFPELF